MNTTMAKTDLLGAERGLDIPWHGDRERSWNFRWHISFIDLGTRFTAPKDVLDGAVKHSPLGSYEFKRCRLWELRETP